MIFLLNYQSAFWLIEFVNQPATKKSVAAKSTVKKGDGVGQTKALGSVETEDVEVICFSEFNNGNYSFFEECN